VLVIILHFTGRLFRNRYGKVQGWLTTTGLIIYILACMIMAAGTFSGRFRFKTERYEVRIGGLHPDLEGLRIVHISDLHLASYYHHAHKLAEAVDIINSEEPDLILNTVTSSHSAGGKQQARYYPLGFASRLGSFAVAGNTRLRDLSSHYSEAERANNVLLINRFTEASGYTMLNDENIIIRKDSAKIMLAGVTTLGRFPDIHYGDVDRPLKVQKTPICFTAGSRP
jgi:predicted MPP superfamily phosphohydrolase